jgi:TonB-dependent starch-binding outer membrane protein SusC
MLTGDELRKYLTDNGVPKLSAADDDGSNTNWQKLAERTGYSQNHNLSYGGAGTNSEYGASVNYLKNNGILKNTSLERTIYKGYINQRFFNDRLKLGITLTNSATKNNDIFQSQVKAPDFTGTAFNTTSIPVFFIEPTLAVNRG